MVLDAIIVQSDSHDVDQLLRHYDDFLNAFAFEKHFHFFRCFCGSFERGVVGVGGDFDDVAQFAIYLHGDFQRVFDEESGVVFGPLGVRERCVLRVACCVKF